MRSSSKVDLMLARVTQGKKAAQCGKLGRVFATEKKKADRRWEQLQREADEELTKKRRKR